MTALQKAAPGGLPQTAKESKTLLKYQLLESRIICRFGTVAAFEKAVGLQITPFLNGECPDLMMRDVSKISIALSLSETEESAFFFGEIFFGHLREEDSREITEKYKTKKPAGLSSDKSQRAQPKYQRSDSMNELLIFSNPEFGELKTIEIDGKPYVGATEVAKMLGYTNPHKAIQDHCRHVTKREGVSLTTNQHGVTTKQTVEMNFIPEGDVYRLIARSQLPSAEKFELWIFDEVLPGIRKTGAYIPHAEPEDDSKLIARALQASQRLLTAQDARIRELEYEHRHFLSDPDIVLKIAAEWKIDRDKRREAELTNIKIRHRNLDYAKLDAIKDIAGKNKISHELVRRYDFIMTHGSRELKEAVDTGVRSISGAYFEIMRKTNRKRGSHIN